MIDYLLLALSTLEYSCGFLIPILYGLAFWGESVSLWQWIGIAAILVVGLL